MRFAHLWTAGFSKADKKGTVAFPEVYVGSCTIDMVKTYKYLGVLICNDLNDNEDLIRQTRNNYARGNMLARNFKMCSDDVKKQLFKSYMYNMYCANLWSTYTKTVYDKLIISYNNCFRFLFQYPSYCSASEMFVSNNVKSFVEIRRNICYGLLNRINRSNNKYMVAYLNSECVKKV